MSDEFYCEHCCDEEVIEVTLDNDTTEYQLCEECHYIFILDTPKERLDKILAAKNKAELPPSIPKNQ